VPDDHLSIQPHELTILSDAAAVQSIALPAAQRAEGVAFSATGDKIAVATADTNAVLLFRRCADGRFETTPSQRVEGADSRLNYPHDIAFGKRGDTELLAVAQRRGSIAIFERKRSDQRFGPEPTFEITGPKTRLQGSDGVAFVPPDYTQLAVCNIEGGTITFYRMSTGSSLRFDVEPVFELRHVSLVQPDGLAFSACGRWLATANHGNQSASIFRRRDTNLMHGASKYWSNPVTVITDPDMRYPHSVAFCRRTDHLVVTNAGGNYFSVYAPSGRGHDRQWSQRPAFRQIVGADSEFHAINATNKMEGGPKGVATCETELAVCTPQHGVRIYPVRRRQSDSAQAL
jgi:DNA-binding beta-propeller fold protein YncE